MGTRRRMDNSVYDVFEDKYIDRSEIDPIAPPERYKEITLKMLISNAERRLADEFVKKEGNKK